LGDGGNGAKKTTMKWEDFSRWFNRDFWRAFKNRTFPIRIPDTAAAIPCTPNGSALLDQLPEMRLRLEVTHCHKQGGVLKGCNPAMPSRPTKSSGNSNPFSLLTSLRIRHF